MAKITSKLQVTIPKRIADEYGIAPGDEVEFVPAGDTIRLVPAGRRASESLSKEERLRLFDEDTARQRQHEKGMDLPAESPSERDWRREDLYTRGKPR
ncbi:MAG TPA: AbrB/MazE/SpoVT family DNA-binding domain-containing protein [Gammaproteobacteria bacterium]|nr:AbrB/MazE/SpoVT family DNA-binding domain-containing protein [Gammaproteobacteria bacterium]